MHIYSVTDPEFRSYGKVLEGYDTAELLAAMEKIAQSSRLSMPGLYAVPSFGMGILSIAARSSAVS